MTRLILLPIVFFQLAFFGARAYGQADLMVVSGYAQGTTYQIKYVDAQRRDVKKSIDSLLKTFDSALSLYDENSELSLFNRSHAVRFRSPFLLPILAKSKEIHASTEGLFDPTVMPLIEAYGFGPGGQRSNAQPFDLDSVRKLVGFQKVDFDSVSVWKSEENVKLDFNAIAQGYSVDVVCDYLYGMGISDFLVEIGGELRGRGAKPDGSLWRVGISNPLHTKELMATVDIKDRALATSGNYRNHYVREGVTYTHIVNPLTCQPAVSDILSITVLAPDAMTADGYATGFLLMGIERLKRHLASHAALDVVVAYSTPDGKMETYISEGLQSYIKLNLDSGKP
jgi:thiamine biosynthesis lipoprotein